MQDADDRLVGAVTLLEDVTHLSEISRLKSEFIAAASHELRTPLTSVQMGIHLLLEGAAGPLDERQQEILQVCREDTDAARSADARTARSVEDRVGRRDAAVRAGAAGRARRARRSTRCGCRSRRKGVRLDVDAPPDLPRSSRRSRPDRARDRQPRHQRDARDAGGRHDHASPRRVAASDVAVSVDRHRRRAFRASTSPRSSSRSCRCRTRRPAAPASA